MTKDEQIEALQAERDCAKECLAGVHKYAADIEARLDRVTGLLGEARLYVEGCFGDLDLKLLSQIDKALNGERM